MDDSQSWFTPGTCPAWRQCPASRRLGKRSRSRAVPAAEACPGSMENSVAAVRCHLPDGLQYGHDIMTMVIWRGHEEDRGREVQGAMSEIDGTGSDNSRTHSDHQARASSRQAGRSRETA